MKQIILFEDIVTVRLVSLWPEINIYQFTVQDLMLVLFIFPSSTPLDDYYMDLLVIKYSFIHWGGNLIKNEESWIQ